MTAAEFISWMDGRGYLRDCDAAADLCVPFTSVSAMLHGHRRVPPDVSRLCRMIEFLDGVAAVPMAEVSDGDASVIAQVRGLLSVWSDAPRRQHPEGGWAWQALRIDRLCRLSAAVQSVADTTAPRLAKARRQAAEMIKEWGFNPRTCRWRDHDLETQL